MVNIASNGINYNITLYDALHASLWTVSSAGPVQSAVPLPSAAPAPPTTTSSGGRRDTDLVIPPSATAFEAEQSVAIEGDMDYESKIMAVVLGKRSARKISLYLRNFRQFSTYYQWSDKHKDDYIETLRKLHENRPMSSWPE